MNLDKFIRERPFLYHLTYRENVPNIIAKGQLFSTSELVRMSAIREYEDILRKRRSGPVEIKIARRSYFIRDQRPISEVNLAKCLTDGWGIGEFLYHLNGRVFMWPTVKRLWSHFGTYADEKPVILRFMTRDIIDANPHVKFCRLNSGATRSNSYLHGAPPERGPGTFLSAADFSYSVGAVAEVTFENNCVISGEYRRSTSPEGRYSRIK
jgi:hypothetical protein